MRKAMGKSLGEEALGEYKDKFIKGAVSYNKTTPYDAENLWNSMVTFGKYGFNKSHAAVYSMISYWCAWAKTYHPMEFAVATLNNARTPETAVKLLREMVRNEGIKYVSLDIERSEKRWTVQDGILIGGLMSIEGMGSQKAQHIIDNREEGFQELPPGLEKMLYKGKSPFNPLFPCEERWDKMYTNYKEFGLTGPPIMIEDVDVDDNGSVLFIGRLVRSNTKDLKYSNIDEARKFYLHLVVEDDTDEIHCFIGDKNFHRLASIVEEGIEGETWYMVRGDTREGRRTVNVQSILNLNKWSQENE